MTERFEREFAFWVGCFVVRIRSQRTTNAVRHSDGVIEFGTGGRVYRIFCVFRLFSPCPLHTNNFRGTVKGLDGCEDLLIGGPKSGALQLHRTKTTERFLKFENT